MKRLLSLIGVCVLSAVCILNSPIAAKAAQTSSVVANAAQISQIAAKAAQTNQNQMQSVVITLAGDCSIGKLSVHGYNGSFDQYFDKYGPEYFFQNVKPYFDLSDMTLVNFEGVLTDSNKLVEKQYNIKGRPEFISVIPAAGIDAVSFGNNHRIDYGDQGVNDTIAAFNSINLPYAFDQYCGCFVTDSGVKVGFVSVNHVYDGNKVEPFLQNGIANLRAAGCDIVLACCHWGVECTYYPTKAQKTLGHKCIDWGADMVVGSHPHVLQGFEYYNGKYIIYSLGNFCFGGHMNPKDKKSMIVMATFNVKDKAVVGESALQVIPCTISSRTDKNDYCPTPATGNMYNTIISNLNSYSRGMKVSIDSLGRLIHE